MADNVLLTSQVIARATLANLGATGFKGCKNMSSEFYASEFGNTTKFGKIGDVMQVPKPQRFIANTTSGGGWEPQGISNIVTPLTVNNYTKVHYWLTQREMTLSAFDLQKRYAKPAAIAIKADINNKVLKFAAQNTFNNSGTPGTAITGFAPFLLAGDLLMQQGCPSDEVLTAIVNRRMSSGLVSGEITQFNDQKVISDQFKKGRVQNQLGYEWEIDETIYRGTLGTHAGTILVNGTNGTPGTTASDQGNNATQTFLLKGLTVGTTVTEDDKFSVAGTYSVHPQTRQSTGSLQQITVITGGTADGSGNLTLTVSPALTFSGQYQNVYNANGAMADGDAVTFWGPASATFSAGLLISSDAYAFLSVPLENPGPGMGADCYTEKDPETGISLSVKMGYDKDVDKTWIRFDTIWGIAPAYRELCCAIAG